MRPHFTALGIPVRVELWFWVGAVFLGYRYFGQNPLLLLLWVAIVFSAILVHELGHAIAFRSFGVPSLITLQALGGITQPLGSGMLTWWRQIIVSVAGPLVGIVIGGGVLALSYYVRIPPQAAPLVTAIVFTNLGWAIFNLMPVYPLDGGQIVHAALTGFFGGRGARWSYLSSIFVAAGLLVLAFVWQHYLAGMFMIFFMVQNYRLWQAQDHWIEPMKPQARPARTSTPPPPKRAGIEDEIQKGWGLLEAGDHAELRRKVEPLVARARTDDERYQVAHLVAWGRLFAGDAYAARRAMGLIPKGQKPDALLEGAVLLESGDPAGAVAPLAEAIDGRPDDFVALRLGRAAARSGRFDEVAAVLEDSERARGIGARSLQIVVVEVAVAGHHEAAARLGELLFDRFGQANDAFNVACSLGQTGRGADAIEWLERAVDAGLSDPSVLDTDADLAPVRALPAFQEVRSRAGLSVESA